MIKTLFKKRSLEHYKLLDKYWTIAIDGTGVFTFNERHCEHCLKKSIEIKKKYPRLPVCLLGDSLYSCEPIFQICNKNKWKYLIRFKEVRIKTLWSEFEQLKKIEANKSEQYLWVNEISYNERFLNILETTVISDGKEKNCFCYGSQYYKKKCF